MTNRLSAPGLSLPFRAAGENTAASPTYLNAFGYTDQGIYCSGNALAGKNIPEGAVEEYYGQYDVYDPILVFISYDGEIQKLDYTPFTMEREHADKYSYESQCYQQGVRLLPDGTFAELAVFSEYWCSVPNLTSEDDAYWETKCFLSTVSPTCRKTW